MSQDIEKVVLGSLLTAPQYLETPELDESLFTGREKEAFRIINQIWEDKRPAEIDPALLAERLGGEGAAAFVGSLLAGLYRLSPELFRDRVLELRKKKIGRRIAARLDEAFKIERKTSALDLSEILPDLEEFRRLERPQSFNVIPLSMVEPKAISWLWPGRIPRGMLTLLIGNPSIGKSFLSIALASRLSRGLPLPDSRENPKCATLFILGEDPLGEAVRPRADANDADASKIFVLQETGFSLKDVAKLRLIHEQNKDLGLIVIDPLSGFLPAKTKFFEDPSVRQALMPIVSFAEESGVAVLAIAHFRKAEAEAAIYRVAGSIGLAGIARSILTIMRYEADKERRALCSLKSNYSKRPDGVIFRIQDDLKIIFEEVLVKADVEEALSSREQRDEVAEGSFAEDWLRNELINGPRGLDEIVKLADKIKISRSALYRTKDKLKIVTKQGGYGKLKTSIWELPQSA